VFVALRGVEKVSQGFIKSRPPNDSFSEAVIVNFEPKDIPIKVLIEIHLRTHASTSDHKMRGKYRSAIYTFSDVQANTARNALAELQLEFDDRLVTQVLQHVAFKHSDDRFVQYYKKNSEGPFCTRYIDPKLEFLCARYADWVKESQDTPLHGLTAVQDQRT
jgi:peptide-methionine (S)-S-oxide reductase